MPSTALRARSPEPKVRSSPWVSMAPMFVRLYLCKQPFAQQPWPRCRVEWLMMKRSVAALAAITAFAVLPAGAQAKVIEIGQEGTNDSMVPACPGKPCLAVSRTTGYQAKVGSDRGLMTVPADGRIVAWTLMLGKPGAKQTDFFNSKLGGESQAQITILDPKRKLRSRAVAQGELMKLQPYFGRTPHFPLRKSIPVKKGQVIALTVPPWAPALGTGLGGDTSWRASREKGQCDDTQGQTAQT